MSDAGQRSNRVEHGRARRWILLQFVENAWREIDVRVTGIDTVLAGPEERHQRTIDGSEHLVAALSPTAALFRHGRDAVIRPERDHVAAAADHRVEMIEQRAYRAIEAQHDVLHFVAGGAVLVADEVEGREADRQEVRSFTSAEAERIDRCCRHASEIVVGERASAATEC